MNSSEEHAKVDEKCGKIPVLVEISSDRKPIG